MKYSNKNENRKEGKEEYTLGQWRLIESMERGNPIEIPSLNLSLNPDGSVSSLDKKLINKFKN